MKNQNDYDYSDGEEKGDISKHSLFVMKFGAYRGGKLGEIVKIKKGRDTLRYYLGWENLRTEARVATCSKKDWLSYIPS